MDVAIDPIDYLPTHESGSASPTTNSKALLDLLVEHTKAIKRWPYDPAHWLDRAHILLQLRYPELACGDAWKAEHCCTTLMAKHHSVRNLRLGAHRGFWMYDVHDADRHEREVNLQVLNGLRSSAMVLQKELTKVNKDKEVIKFISQPYPWLDARHRSRSDALLQCVNDELATGQPLNKDSQPYCQAKRGAHATPRTSLAIAGSDEAWGVFAQQTIPAGSTIIKDSSKIWGCDCLSPTRRKRCFQGPKNCFNPPRPHHESDEMSLDLSWVWNVAKDNIDRTLLRVRCLLQCIKDGVAHPLDHPILARLRPTYHNAELLSISGAEAIAIPNLALLQFGIDILANQNFDTWVLLTIEARLDNNCWSQPNACCLNSLFALFNHSCEPNITWECQKDHRTVHMSTLRQIEVGEQLFVQYNSYMDDKSVWERQEVLSRWIDGYCSCARCERELRAEKAVSQIEAIEAAAWNCGVLALPEDLLLTSPALDR